jgi:hypothetical protein
MHRTARTALLLGLLALSSAAGAQSTTIVKPEFLLIVDTSGSMTATTGTGTNSCGYRRTRINDAACVVRNIADGVGDAIFGLETFALTCSNTTTCHYTSGTSSSCGSCGNTATNVPGYRYPFLGCVDSSEVQVNIAESLAWELRTWGDGAFTSCAEPSGLRAPNTGGNELSNQFNASCPGAAVSRTPLAGALHVAFNYLANLTAGRTSPYVDFNSTGAVDPYHACRPVNVILMTDGDESCVSGGSTPAANNARNIGCLRIDLDRNGRFDNPGAFGNEFNVDVNGDGDCYDTNEQVAFRTRTFAIGFGIPIGDADIENIALGGGIAPHPVRGSTGMYRGYYAQNETDISDAINDIVSQSALRELCNGIDDDCDGLVDEDFAVGPRAMACAAGTGACRRTGTTVCNATQDGVTCNATPGAPAAENTGAACANGQDDDCDGFTDCGDPDCATQPACRSGCVPTAEICDGRDNDCDGLVDEGGITRPCGTNVGECVAGTETCQTQAFPGSGTPMWGACTGRGPTAEVCDGLDNNCNGVADEGLTRACGSSVGACRPGTQQCVQLSPGVYGFGGACVGAIGPSAEICDGVDNDCDGMTDEGIPPGGSCGAGGVGGVGVCTAGTIQCMGGRLQCVGGTMPGTETCNGLDDDCNGVVDDGIPSTRCSPSGVTIPTDAMGNPIGACRFGATVCRGGMTVCDGAVGPSAEVCNGLDDNCNGMADEGLGTGMPCGSSVGACRPGTLTCMGGRAVCTGGVGPMPETCNGIDDDCDGEVDEGNPGGGGACGMSVGECSAGVNRCVGGRIVCEGGRGPTSEICNGLDDDCDGSVDEDIPAGGPCGSSVGECRPGTQRCIAGRMVCEGARGPQPEECNCRDDDCDGMIDEMASGGTPLCGGGSVCAGAPHCACLRPCAEGEFPCPSGRTCENVSGQRLCVGDPCASVRCNEASETCVNGECRSRCAGVTCEAGLVCDPRTGSCVANDCRILQNCTAGQICRGGMCQPHPCAGVTCPEGQACYEGTCGASCANVHCAAGEVCVRGVCQTGNRCAGVTCATGQVCNPADGTCTMDACTNRGCPRDQACNPLTGNCEDDPCAVVVCPTGQVCVRGECTVPVDTPRPPPPPRDRVIGSGGGGMACAATPAPGHVGSTRAALEILALALALAGARRRAGRARREVR